MPLQCRHVGIAHGVEAQFQHVGSDDFVAPTAHLKVQWARAAVSFGLHLDPAWAAADGHLPADMHGIVTSYQQVATQPGPGPSIPAQLDQLDDLRKRGVITEAEFAAKKAELLNRM